MSPLAPMSSHPGLAYASARDLLDEGGSRTKPSSAELNKRVKRLACRTSGSEERAAAKASGEGQSDLWLAARARFAPSGVQPLTPICYPGRQ